MTSKRQKTSFNDNSSVSFLSPPSDAGSVKKKCRAKNFTEKEDELLCRAYVNVSTDSSVGNNQRASVFWEKVKERFDSQLESAGVPLGFERDVKSLTNRFSRHIAPSVTNLNRFLRQVKKEKPSGTPEDEFIDEAIKRYEDSFNKSFFFKSCVSILQELPKYNPIPTDGDVFFSSDEEGGDSSPASAINFIGAPMGANKPRPLGCKAAKNASRSNATRQTQMSLQEADIAAMEKLAAAQETLAEAMKQQVEVSKKKNACDEKKIRMEHLSKLWDMYNSMGKDDKAADIFKQIEELVGMDS
jgi:hypothetical protein